MVSFITGLKALWIWLRHHWMFPVIITAVIILMFLNHDKAFELMKLLTKQTNSYNDELAKLQAAHQKELDERDAAIKRYQAAMAQVEANYQSQQLALDASKRKEIEKIIKTTNGDPQELAQKLSEATGFRVILPEE